METVKQKQDKKEQETTPKILILLTVLHDVHVLDSTKALPGPLLKRGLYCFV